MRRVGTLWTLAVVATAFGACKEKVPLGSWGSGVTTGGDDSMAQGDDGSVGATASDVVSVDTDTAASDVETPAPPGMMTDMGTDATRPLDASAPPPDAAPNPANPDAGMRDGGTPSEFPACLEEKTPGPFNAPGLGGFGSTEISTNWLRAAPSTSLSWDLMIEQNVPERDEADPPVSGYYWAHRFTFEEGIAGIFGLQSEGFYQPDPVTNPGDFEWAKIAVLWISGPQREAELGDIPYPSARIATANGAGSNWTTIHALFEWEECHVYRLSITPETTEDDGSTWYGAWIDDTTADERILLGRILLPPDTGPLSPFSLSRTSPIDHGMPTTCDAYYYNHQYSSAMLGAPVGDGYTAANSGSIFTEPTRCGTSRTTEFENAVRHELGVRR